MNYRNNKLAILALGASLLTTAHEANAFSSYASDISSTCSDMGYDLSSDYALDSCSSCHGDNQAKSAYSGGNYEYFCPAPVETVCTDNDGDGYYAEGESCGTPADFNDGEAAAYPGASEDCADGVDNDGNGLVDGADPNAVGCVVACTDMDMDGYAIEGGSCGAIDCDDNDGSVNPGAAEVCSDAVDNNCNGLTDTADMNAVDCPLDCTDNDGDGYSIEGGSCGAMDCDDNNAEVNPGALEICDDGVDNNCNSQVDSIDAVCQGNEVDDGQCEEPWWRSKYKRHHGHKKDCVITDEGDEDSGNEHDESDESDGHEEDDDGRTHGRRERSDDRDEHRRWFRSLRQ
jgi:hypothetical protein